MLVSTGSPRRNHVDRHHARHFSTLSIFATLLAFNGCAVGTPGAEEPSVPELHPLDLEPIDDGKADGTTFRPHRIVTDQAFSNARAVDAATVQAFLENTPYGTRSFLADLVVEGERLSAALVRVAASHEINPLVLLATLQKETGLVSRETAPNAYRVNYAFGCGCPDGSRCDPASSGLDRQLACAADALSHPFTAPLRGEPTRAGVSLGDSIRTLDGIQVTPDNRATLALYTYTPWVGRASRSGNWLFFTVWKRYVTHIGYAEGLEDRAGENFIGSACDDDVDCGFLGGFCLERDGGQFCSQRCRGTCPDRVGHPTTLCTDLEIDGEGYCVARCDSVATCLPRQWCVPTARFEDPAVILNACAF